jgi:hypothetical protein
VDGGQRDFFSGRQIGQCGESFERDGAQRPSDIAFGSPEAFAHIGVEFNSKLTPNKIAHLARRACARRTLRRRGDVGLLQDRT